MDGVRVALNELYTCSLIILFLSALLSFSPVPAVLSCC